MADIIPLFPAQVVDAQVENHGTLFLVRPLTEAASDWLDDNVSDDAQYFGGALVVEHRYIAGLVEGMLGDGLNVA
jgi:hypothetical protein